MLIFSVKIINITNYKLLSQRLNSYSFKFDNLYLHILILQ